MTLTDERAEMIANYLTEDDGRATQLFELFPAEVQKKINADGYDFTLEEIQEFGSKLQIVAASRNGELSESSLTDVTGGANSSFWLGVATGSGIGAAVCFTGAAICACCW